MPETDANFSGEEEISQVNQFYTRTSGKKKKKRVEELKNKSCLNKRINSFKFRGNDNTQINLSELFKLRNNF